MGNGQSSPAGTHPHPPAAKVQTSHREHHRRSPSPGGAQRQQQQLSGGHKASTGDNRRGSTVRSSGVAASTGGTGAAGGRKKSLELPDLTRLNFTAANSASSTAPAAGAGVNGSPASTTNGLTSAASSPVTKPIAGSRGILGRKRPSPLAPTIMTSPLSPISPKQTSAHATSHSTATQQQQQQQHNPYFPAEPPPAPVSAEASPIDIPLTPSQGTTPGLPAYDRMTYAAEPLAAARRQSAAAEGAMHAHSLQPPSTTRHRPSQQQQQQDVSRKTAMAADNSAVLSGAKKARIADGPPAVVPPVEPSPSSSLSPRQHAQQHHRPKQSSVAGVDEDNTIRSSLPSGGDEFPPGHKPADNARAASSSAVQRQATSLSATAETPAVGRPAAATSAAGDGGMLGLSISGNAPAGEATPASSVEAGLAASKPRRQREETFDIESAEEGVPTIINWTGGGKEVYVCGTFAKNWKERLKMSKSTHDFTLVLNLPPGPHRLKFIVDETWRCSDDLANATDADGSLVNYIEVEPRRKDGGGPGWSSEWDAHMGVDSDDDSQWTNEIPDALIRAQAIEEQHLAKVAALPPANKQPGSIALQNPQGLPHPPGLPRHLEKVILNNPPKDGSLTSAGTEKVTAGGACWTATPDDNSILPIPNHVVLNHLTASAIRNGVLAVGTTTRYKRKYISTLLYKPVEL